MRVRSIFAAVAVSTVVTMGAALLTFAQTEGRELKDADSQTPSIETLSKQSSARGRQARLAAVYAESRINIRSEPTVRSSILYEGRVGDRVQILDEARGRDDRYTWYRVRFETSSTEGWVRQDLVYLLDGAPAPSQPPAPDDSQRTQPPSAPAPSSGQQNVFSQEEIDYFLEVALGTEFGPASQRVRKWDSNVRIRLNGTPTAEDRRTLNAVVQELNDLIDGISLQIVDSNPNVEMYFVPESEFRRYEPNYRPINMGYAWVGWRNDVINRSRVLISTVGVTQEERSHLIREELTQAMGLMRDSNRYRDSIFFQGWTRTTQYAAIDRRLIQMLYQPDMRAGMTREQAVQAIAQINSGQAAARLRADNKSETILDALLEKLQPNSDDE